MLYFNRFAALHKSGEWFFTLRAGVYKLTMEHSMYHPENFALEPKTYQWYMRMCTAVEKHLGLNVVINDDHNALKQGHIFLFNHFTRFETAIPPYTIYRETGIYARSIADQSLFNVNQHFTNFLTKMGVVPNRLPGLLPYLAGEILRGRKVIIFPEGGLVKDKKVTDGEGRFQIYSSRHQTYRKHHRGAAVLALVLDLFKHRVKYLERIGDTVRLERWREHLDLPTVDHLLKAAHEPTFIVPSNITFYPVRVGDNVLSKTVSKINGIPSSLVEDLAIEGNILFRDTDMNINFGAPQAVERPLSWFEQSVLNRYFSSIDSLEELFELREQQNGWSEKFLVGLIDKHTRVVRDKYMEAIYRTTTINLNHVIAEAIVTLMEQGEKVISKQLFAQVVYRTIKELQNDKNLQSHCSITWPDFYEGIMQGTSRGYNGFVGACIKAGLLAEEGDNYRLRRKLKSDFGPDEIRQHNPVLMQANEAEPILALHDAVNKVWHAHATYAEADLARHMFDDELRDYAYARTRYANKDVHSKRLPSALGRPYLLAHKVKNKGKVGVLLIHGLLASPGELKVYGEKLHAQGYTVLGMRLPGHGTSPWDLHKKHTSDWQKAVARNYRILAAQVDKVIIVGFSTGGVLGLIQAGVQNNDKLAGVVAAAAPLALRDRNSLIVPLVGRLNKLVSKLPFFHGVKVFYNNGADHPRTNYATVPVQAIYELQQSVKALKKVLGKVQVPTLILQSKHDDIIKADSAEYIYNNIASSDKKIIYQQGTAHGIIANNVGTTWADISAFIVRVTQEEK